MAENNTKKTGRSYAGLSQQERKKMRYEQFMQAGLEVFGSSGYRQATVRGMCRQAQLTDRYFYESFGSLEKLLVAVYERCMTSLSNQILQVLMVEPKASIDERNQLVYGIIEVRNLKSIQESIAVELPVGLFVSVNVEGRTIDNVISIPRTALNDAGLIYVIDPATHVMSGHKANIIQVQDSFIVVRGDSITSSQMVVQNAPPWAQDGIEIRPRVNGEFIAKTTVVDSPDTENASVN